MPNMPNQKLEVTPIVVTKEPSLSSHHVKSQSL